MPLSTVAKAIAALPSLKNRDCLPFQTWGQVHRHVPLSDATIHYNNRLKPMNTRLLSTLGAIALLGPISACVAPSEPESSTGRSAYGEISLPPESQRLGANPEQVALEAFGITEIPSEGNFSQETELVEQTAESAIVTLTQTGLLDDSVEGMRYWLEFDAGENAWEMVWAGRQVRCYPGRGSQEWTTELCN